jgi:hypothetical protein
MFWHSGCEILPDVEQRFDDPRVCHAITRFLPGAMESGAGE